MLRNWIKQVDAIKTKAETIKGETRDIESFNKERYRNFVAEKLYPELDFSIWDKLHEFKYFEGGARYGPRISEYDSDKGVDI